MPQKLIDLTHVLNENISVYPDTLGPAIEQIHSVDKDGFAELKVTMVLHSGTHIDAPSHVIRNGKSLDQFPLDKFTGFAVVISCLSQTEIGLDFLRRFERTIANVDFVLFYTGWQHKWSTPAYLEESPVPTTEAAEWLSQFRLKGVGFDSFSVDIVASAHTVTVETLPNHHILLGKEILLIENLTNLDKLPAGTFTLQCFPLRIGDADGSPVRAIAIVD